MREDQQILDWQLNDQVPNAVEILAQSELVELLTPFPPDPIYRQLDERWPLWKAWGPGFKWELLAADYLFHPNTGTLIPAAMAWLGQEKIVVYKHKLFCIIQPNNSFTVGTIK